MSFLSSIEVAPPNAIFKLTADYKEDTFEKKLNLGVGAYRDAEGNPWVLPVVKKAEARIQANIESGAMNHEYLPIGGLKDFNTLTTAYALGDDNIAIKDKRADVVQCLSGTGSLRTAGEFFSKFSPVKTIYSSKPTWANHGAIFRRCGLDYHEYRYFEPQTKGLDYDGMMADLKAAPDGCAVVLHACAHNPTGVDPTESQWKDICALAKTKGFFVVFDAAYTGFASGDPVKDSFAMRHFAAEGVPLVICQSYSKNFGLYNERTGAVVFVGADADSTAAAISQMKLLVRANWSNPPAHGARIVATVLGDADLKQEWFDCLKIMSGRIAQMREQLFNALKKRDTPGTWDHIMNQIGMFSFTGLSAKQVEYMTEKYHIYMLKNGRVNMCGLTEPTVDILADAIDDAVRNISE